MKALFLILTLITASTASAQSSADGATEAGSINVNECVKGDCPQKHFDTPAFHNVQNVPAIVDNILNPEKALPDIQPSTSTQ